MNDDFKKNLFNKVKEKAINTNQIEEIPIDKLLENPYQPRIEMKQTEIEELAKSIEENGLLQPILINKTENGYIIIAGHRRTEAHKFLNKKFIKAIILNNQKDIELAKKSIVENLQRKDLNIIETAMALKKYKQDFNKKLDEIGIEIGKDKTFVSKILSILNLPKMIVDDIKKNKSTQDVRALSMINAFSNNLKKLDMSNFSEHDIEIKLVTLYKGFLKNGRKWLEEEIKKILNDSKKSEEPIVVKHSKKGITIQIKDSIKDINVNEFKKELTSLIEKYK